MIKGKGDIVINRPVEEAWKFLTDFEDYPKWHKGMAEARQTSEGPRGAGTILEVGAEFLGRHTMTLVITDFQPNEKIAWRSTCALSRARSAMWLAAHSSLSRAGHECQLY